ncbi:CPC_1213 family protein [Aminipila terrae]|uniref:CPC_1213 family protein n=1 Tax=Aminipila terrae TaxID=2697030 RepID=UPI00192F7753|nr:CPC_1213 family protein [Aminipila terrae]
MGVFKKNKNKNEKKNDGKFHSKHIKHDPQAESARAVFGLNKQEADEQENQ